ncbi:MULTISPECIES: hypothetical protein [unclassified Coleofasciculus]|uniref:hypothetical protein n=1 Tax=unclassified Coleofasciculus TaxID=2692782 RepID=UPI00187F14BE|nr:MULTISPECIES: hypothetical protein [unclassified Coleofasciculus]MBE9126909.1 hypothetical protein [Coleofasciculus sp. LEGE 07081]MBE9150195.1 hypothetical protein [Coleofasciculus sp. LEGE 07092]
MAYSNFTLAKVKEEFDLTVDETQNLFTAIEPIKPSEILTVTLQEYISLATAIGTEKARSEFLIAPILSEVRRQLNYQISLFSGTDFTVNVEKGLLGYCDFLLSASREQFFITAPVVTIVEAKNENIIGGLGQCVAEMIAAQLFNQRQAVDIPVIYGAVTSGTNWRFLTLTGNKVCIDLVEYYINQFDKILGILLSPIQAYLSRVNP